MRVWLALGGGGGGSGSCALSPFSPVPDWAVLGSPLCRLHVPVFFLIFEKISEAFDNREGFCENPTALTLVFIDHIIRL